MDDIQELYNLFPELKAHICVEKKIGQGTFSYVYLGHFLKNKEEKVALKYIIPTSSPSRTKQEIECLLNIGGRENVISVLSVLRNRSHILIFMPYIEHESFHESFIFWDINEVREYIRNLLIALNRVHQCGIIHRDVKPSNFLYDRKRKQYALVDFGLAQTYDKSTSESVFVYESLNKKAGSTATMTESSTKKNFIAVNSISSSSSSSKKFSASSHLILTNTQLQQQQNRVVNSASSSAASSNQTTPKAVDVNSMPHGPMTSSALAARKISSSQSFDRNLSNSTSNTPGTHQDENKMPTNPMIQNRALNVVGLSQSKVNRTASPNLQKFHSFHKTNSFHSEAKCNCFNTQFVCDICTTRNNKWAPRAGTAGFRAPEILFRSSCQTPAIDVWSAGIIFLSLLSGRYPFFKAVDDSMAIMQLVSLFGVDSVKKGAYKYGESLICSYEKKPVDLKELCVELRINMIKGIREHKSKKKYSEKEIDSIRKEFPDAAYDLLKKLLDIDCEKRLTAEHALSHPFFTENN